MTPEKTAPVHASAMSPASGPRKEARTSSAYIDVAFMLLAVGAFVVLGIQTLDSNASVEGPVELFVTDHETATHFGGRISLIETAPAVYVTRADGTRFGIGDELPGGAVLVAIETTSLMLEAPEHNVLIKIPE